MTLLVAGCATVHGGAAVPAPTGVATDPDLLKPYATDARDAPDDDLTFAPLMDAVMTKLQDWVVTPTERKR